MATMGALLLVLFLGLSSVSAFSTRSRPALAALHSRTKLRTTAESCFYNLNLANYAGNGFSGKQVTVTVGGSVALTESLLYLVYEKSVPIPVLAGQSISLHYGDGVETRTANSFWVTDANGLSVLTVDNATTGDYAVPSVASCVCEYETTSCPAVRVRNEYRSLSYCDKTNFIAAITTFRENPTTTHNYTNFILLHNTLSPAVIHRELFLPWHRAFILEFENGLRSQGGRFACVTLPFWDWSLDFGHERESPVLAELGGYEPARSCLNGTFANWMNPVTGKCVIRRDFYLQPFYPSVACTSAVEIGITANSSYWFVFTYFVRNPHKSVHIYVGGSKGTMGSLSSPADPVFWLHHANIDRAWAMWQDCWDFDKPGTAEAQYRDISGIMPLDEAMINHYVDTNTTVRSMLDIQTLHYRYPPTFRTLKRLVGSQPVYEDTTETCKWDWFDPINFKTAVGHKHRVEALAFDQEQRLSASRASYKSELDHSANYYSAMTAQLKKECDIANGTYNDDWPVGFEVLANNVPIIGPAEYFKNACQLMKDKTLEGLFVA